MRLDFWTPILLALSLLFFVTTGLLLGTVWLAMAAGNEAFSRAF